jgi:transposase-like protein
VQLAMAPGASVAEVTRAHGVNANQVFKWRRAFERGKLIEPCAALIPVTVSRADEAFRPKRKQSSYLEPIASTPLLKVVATPASCAERESVKIMCEKPKLTGKARHRTHSTRNSTIILERRNALPFHRGPINISPIEP